MYGEDLYRLLPAIQSISFIYEYNMFKMKMKLNENQCSLMDTQEFCRSDSLPKWKCCIVRWTTETVITNLNENNVTYVKVILHQFWVKTSFPWKFIWNTMVPLPSYSCMFPVEICSQQLEICKSVYTFFVLSIVETN